MKKQGPDQIMNWVFGILIIILIAYILIVIGVIE